MSAISYSFVVQKRLIYGFLYSTQNVSQTQWRCRISLHIFCSSRYGFQVRAFLLSTSIFGN
jgi:hypothetical protein